MSSIPGVVTGGILWWSHYRLHRLLLLLLLLLLLFQIYKPSLKPWYAAVGRASVLGKTGGVNICTPVQSA